VDSRRREQLSVGGFISPPGKTHPKKPQNPRRNDPRTSPPPKEPPKTPKKTTSDIMEKPQIPEKFAYLSASESKAAQKEIQSAKGNN